LGLALTALAVLLTGAGHGTYVPIIANASYLWLIPGIGILLAIFAPPLQWALYFALIPAIQSRLKRVLVMVAVELAHLVLAVVLVNQDPSFTRALEQEPRLVIAHGLGLVSTLAVLALLWARRKLGPNCTG
jgi:hypothetical protein